MKLVGRIPVEPLSDERLTNIERAIVSGAADAAAKGRARESRWPVFGFATVTVVLVIGAGLVGWQLRGGGDATVVETAPLAVKTDANTTTIDIGDARITSDPATAFTITRPGTGVRVAMTRGKVALEVGKRIGKDPLIVHAGDTDVEVVGTQFSVDYDDKTGEVDVRVTEGKVRVIKRSQAPAFVAAGEVWQTKRGKIALADAGTKIAKADRTPDEIVIPVEPAKDGKETKDGKEPKDGKDVGLHDRTAHVPDARIPTTGSGSAKSSVLQGGPENVRLQPVAPSNPNLDLLKAITEQPVAPALDVKLDPPSAVSEYLRIAAGTVRGEASRAFYSIAVVQYFKLGRDSEAVATLDAYFRRFRKGNDAPDYLAARWLDVRIKCVRRNTKGRFELVINDRCRQAAYTYAHEAPASSTRSVAEILSTARGD